MDNIRPERIPSPFKEVLKGQKPEIPGHPYEMKVFQSTLPKSAGDPWRGAYSKHGFWYKFHTGGKADFDELVAISTEQDKYMLNYDCFLAWQKAYGTENIRIISAKNLKNEIMGGIVAIKKKDYTQIGTYFVKEEYRHSGIGSKLFKEVTERTGRVAFQAMHHLLPTLSTFGLLKQFGRRFIHVKIDCPNGFPDLIGSLVNCHAILSDEGDPFKWDPVSEFDETVSGEARSSRELSELENVRTGAVYDNEGKCLGYGTLRELAGRDFVKRLLVGPLYAVNDDVAELILRTLLRKYYNPDEDYDFDPDVFAIYRRTVEFILPAHEKLIPVIKKLNGTEGKLTQERMWYQTCSSFAIPKVQMDMVYAVGDLHSTLV
uniref:N-acetyltransferase domain-containing protein n=1 Tax=Haemonchus contortus TaxID=6289 RepID=A0A7I4YH65_HAECO